MGTTIEQRAEIEKRLLAYVQQTGSVTSASAAVEGAHIRKQTGLRVFHALKQRGAIREQAVGGFVVADDGECAE